MDKGVSLFENGGGGGEGPSLLQVIPKDPSIYIRIKSPSID